MSKFIVSKNLLNKFAHWESNLLTENQFCSRRIMNCPSFYLQSKYGLMTQFLSVHKSLKAKNICSQWRKTAHKNQICSFAQTNCQQQKFAHRICSQIRKTAHDENLAGSDGSTQWLNVLYQANRSTAGVHQSTVSVVTAGTCWAGFQTESLQVHLCMAGFTVNTPEVHCSTYSTIVQ
jgi:hypothetical protein